MNEVGKYEAYKKKLQGICDEHNLLYSFEKTKYPITLTIKPIEGMQNQLTLFEEGETETSPDAYIRFRYLDGDVDITTSETFTIGDTLFTKLKNLFKNMYFCWVQHFFRNVIERELISPEALPEIDEDEANDTDIQLPEGAEMLEEFEVDLDEELKEATRIVRMENKASTSLLQRRMNVDEEKAEAIMEQLEILGVVGPYNEGESREVLPYDEPEDCGNSPLDVKPEHIGEPIDTEDGADDE